MVRLGSMACCCGVSMLGSGVVSAIANAKPMLCPSSTNGCHTAHHASTAFYPICTLCCCRSLAKLGYCPSREQLAAITAASQALLPKASPQVGFVAYTVTLLVFSKMDGQRDCGRCYSDAVQLQPKVFLLAASQALLLKASPQVAPSA
jgi:hypothetical protein